MLDIGRSDWLRGLRNFIGYRGHTSFSLAEDVLPVLDLSVMPAPFHTAVGVLGTAAWNALAANYSYVGLYLPSASAPRTRRSVVRDVYLSVPGQATPALIYAAVIPEQAAAALVFTSNQALGSWDSVPNPQATTDLILGITRVIALQSVTALLNAGNALGVAAPGETGAQQSLRLAGPFVLGPGAMLVLQTGNVNIGLRAGFVIDEYDVG